MNLQNALGEAAAEKANLAIFRRPPVEPAAHAIREIQDAIEELRVAIIKCRSINDALTIAREVRGVWEALEHVEFDALDRADDLCVITTE